MPATRLARAAIFISVMLLISLAPAAVAAGARGESPAPAAHAGLDLSKALSDDGTFVGADGIVGGVDMSKWRLVSDMSAGEPPRFAPIGPGVTANGWSNLGGSSNGALNSLVYAVAVGGGSVYVGGNFYQSAGLPVNADFVARWDGSSWSALGSNGSGGPAINGPVYALLYTGGNLLAGGDFSNAGGDPQADDVAIWNGATWSDVAGATGTGDGAFNGQVYALALYADDLYMGGYWFNAAVFGTSSPNPGDMILRWNFLEHAWHWVGTRTTGDGAIQGPVNALIATPTGVIAGGAFTNAGDTTIDYLAEYTIATGAWTEVHGSGTSFNAQVRALYQSGSNLWVGGDFTDFSGILPADHLVRWNGSAWGAPGGGNGESAIKARVYAIVGSGSNVFVGGNFVDAGITGNSVATADRVAKWNGTAWSGLGSNGAGDGALNTGGAEPPGWVRALALSSTALYAGGSFRDAGTVAQADYVASYGLGSTGSAAKPDGRIKKGSGTLVGNNIYNLTGTNQTRTGKAAIGSTITFTISMQNDGTATDKFKVSRSCTSPTGYQVTYFRGTTNITTAVNAGTYQTANVAPTNATPIKARVKIVSGAASGSSIACLVSVASVNDPTKSDVVKFIAKRS